MLRLRVIRNRTPAAEFGLLFVTVIWGVSFAATKCAADQVTPAWILLTRFGPAAALLVPFARKRPNRLCRADLKAGLVLGLLNFLACELQTWGAKYTTAGNNAFLTTVYCVAVPFLDWAVRRRRPRAANIVSAFLCIAGVGFLSLRGNFSIQLGDLLSLGSGFAFALQIVVIGIVSEKRDPILLTGTQCAFTALAALPVALAEPFPATITLQAALSLVFLSLFATLLATLIQMVCQKYVASSKASLIMSMESVFGCLSGVLFLGESLTARFLEGSALILTAILLCEVKLPARAAAAAVLPKNSAKK